MSFRSLCLLLGLAGVAATAPANPPNILFIAVDDLRPELNCYGATHMVTPNLDTLAGQGRLFRNHYVAVPTCGASRYALMSGLRPTAATDNNDAFDRMPTSEPADPESWVDLLRRNGWHTASIGKITHEPDGYRWSNTGTYDYGRTKATRPDMFHSFNEIIWDHDRWGAQRYPLFAYADGTGRVKVTTPAYEIGTHTVGQSVADEDYPDGQMAQAAIDKLREFAEEETRFCLAVGFMKPHLPFNAPKAYYDLYDPASLPAPSPAGAPINNNYTGSSSEINSYTDRSDKDQLRHAYFACVSYVDAQIGKVLNELDALDLADNTVVILWGDHGWCLDDYGGEMGKHRVLERALESPLIIRAPAGWNPGAYAGIATEGVVETLDLYPTIAELCGLTPPTGPDGSSLVPMLLNPFAPGKDMAYSRFGSARSVRSSDWRLIDNGSGQQDLYDLSTYRYELEDVSASHPDPLAELNTGLAVQGTRPGTNYVDYANGNPLLIDPYGDGDGDGSLNIMEYRSGSDPLGFLSRPPLDLKVEDLSIQGYGSNDVVFSYTLWNYADDGSLTPDASGNLIDWGFVNLDFLDATQTGTQRTKVRFRVTDPGVAQQFLRLRVTHTE